MESTKTPLIYSVLRFNVGALELCLVGLSPPKPPRGDGTALELIFTACSGDYAEYVQSQEDEVGNLQVTFFPAPDLENT